MDTQKELLSVLLDRADKGKHLDFKFIKTWREYWTVRSSLRSVEIVVKNLTKSYNSTFKKYCKAIPAGEAQFIKLIACSTLRSAITFYEEEYNILFDMLEEFETYAARGKFLDPLLFGQRPDQDLWDHRKD